MPEEEWKTFPVITSSPHSLHGAFPAPLLFPAVDGLAVSSSFHFPFLSVSLLLAVTFRRRGRDLVPAVTCGFLLTVIQVLQRCEPVCCAAPSLCLPCTRFRYPFLARLAHQLSSSHPFLEEQSFCILFFLVCSPQFNHASPGMAEGGASSPGTKRPAEGSPRISVRLCSALLNTVGLAGWMCWQVVLNELSASRQRRRRRSA